MRVCGEGNVGRARVGRVKLTGCIADKCYAMLGIHTIELGMFCYH